MTRRICEGLLTAAASRIAWAAREKHQYPRQRVRAVSTSRPQEFSTMTCPRLALNKGGALYYGTEFTVFPSYSLYRFYYSMVGF